MTPDVSGTTDSPPPAGREKKPYEKPAVTSHRVFEVSLACIKVPGSAMCHYNVTRTRS